MLITKFRRALATNSSDAAFPDRPATIIKPVNDGVLVVNPAASLGASGGRAPWGVRLMPVGAGTAMTFALRMIGWNVVLGPAQEAPLWVHQPLVEIAVTLGVWPGLLAGAAGSIVPANEAFASGITLVAGMEPLTTDGVGAKTGKTFVYSPANNKSAAYVDVPIMGAELIEPLFDRLSTDTPVMNCLYRWLYCDE